MEWAMYICLCVERGEGVISSCLRHVCLCTNINMVVLPFFFFCPIRCHRRNVNTHGHTGLPKMKGAIAKIQKVINLRWPAHGAHTRKSEHMSR